MIHTRLTAAKEAGATISINGKDVALGVPGAKAATEATAETYPGIPLQRGGSADEAASATLFLASPMASYVTGHTLEVTGGAGI